YAALRLEPDGEGAEQAKRQLTYLGLLDPSRLHQQALAADAKLAEGEVLREAGKKVEAIQKYRDAVETYGDSLRAWMRIAEMSVLLGSDYDEEGLRAIENVRDLDLDGRFPEPD